MKLKKQIAFLVSSFMLCNITAYAEEQVKLQDSISNVESTLNGMYTELSKTADSYISEYPDYSELINDLLHEYSTDPELCREYEYSPDNAIETFSKSIEIELEIASHANCIAPTASTVVGSGLGVLYYCYVDDSIVQEENDWCGVASTLMALTGIEEYNSGTLVNGYVRPTQSQIADNVYDSSLNSAVVGLIKNYLNTKVTYNTYTFKEITGSVSKTQVKNYIQNSLEKNRPVILHAKPYKAFNYYSNMSSYTTGHYIVVEDYNSYTNTFTIADCTYVSNYQGRHTGITLDEIYNSLYSLSNGVSGRYIIYA